jgi:hypothetical protein
MYAFFVDLLHTGNYMPVLSTVGDEMINQHNINEVRAMIENALSMHVSFRVEAW